MTRQAQLYAAMNLAQGFPDFAAPAELVLRELRGRDVLLGRAVAWAGGEGVAAGIDDVGRLLVQRGDEVVALDAGEVHLRPAAA